MSSYKQRKLAEFEEKFTLLGSDADHWALGVLPQEVKQFISTIIDDLTLDEGEVKKRLFYSVSECCIKEGNDMYRHQARCETQAEAVIKLQERE